jgi:hypothetical protein
MTQLTLLPECVLPGCKLPTETVGHPCPDCLTVFDGSLGGWRIVANTAPEAAPPMTEEQIAERDEAVARAYRNMARAAQGLPAEDYEPERKRNQTCWLCDERRTCTRVAWSGDKQWECDACQEIE